MKRIIYDQGRALRVISARGKTNPVRLLPLCKTLDTVPAHTAVLGLDDDGTPLLLRLVAPEVLHVLIAGKGGAGKSALTRMLLTSLAMYNRQSDIQLVLIDLTARGFAPLASLPHVLGRIADTPERALARLTWLAAEMERRDLRGERDPKLIVAVDELVDLLQMGEESVEVLLNQLIKYGPERGIHFVACTQKLATSLVSSAMMAKFPARLVGAVANKQEASYAAGVEDSGAEKLIGKGDFLLVNQGQIIHFQAAWMGPKTLHFINERLHNGNRNTRRWGEGHRVKASDVDQAITRRHNGPKRAGFLALLQEFEERILLSVRG